MDRTVSLFVTQKPGLCRLIGFSTSSCLYPSVLLERVTPASYPTFIVCHMRFVSLAALIGSLRAAELYPGDFVERPVDEIARSTAAPSTSDPNLGAPPRILIPSELATFELSRTEMFLDAMAVGEIDASPTESHLPYVGIGEQRSDLCPELGLLDISSTIKIGQDAAIFLANLGNSSPSSFHGKRKYESSEPEKVVVKYGTNCRERMQMPWLTEHPLKREYIMMKLLDGLELTPKVYYLSPRAVLVPDVEIPGRVKTRFLMANMGQCMALKSEVRFMVMEEAGVSLQQYTSGLRKYYPDYYLSNAWSQRIIQITRNMLDKLEKIHEKGIVHNDIHGGNMVFRTRSSSVLDADLVLLDFAFSLFYPDEIGKDALDPHSGSVTLTPRYLSIWQLLGQRSGPRDDIYRLIYTMGDLLTRYGHSVGIKKLIPATATVQEHREITLRAKQEEPLFLPSSLLGAHVYSLDSEILQQLEDIHNHVKTYTHPDMRVDYAFIRAALESIIASFA